MTPTNLDCHNDGVQINSSINVLIKDYFFAGTGHSAAFIGAGSDGFPGRNVVFDGGCWGDTEPVEGKPNHRTLDVGISIAESSDSGVRNVTIEPAKQHEIYVPQTPSSGGPPATGPDHRPQHPPTRRHAEHLSRPDTPRPLTARNLQHVRAQLGADLVEQVDEITQDLGQEVDTLTAWIDNSLLRGIPAIGGVITDSTIPGSDEHLDSMDIR